MQDPQEEELYDEFGNYIGPDLESSSDDSSSAANSRDDDDSETSAVSDLDDTNATPHHPHNDDEMNIVTVGDTRIQQETHIAAPANQIILHEDKVHYPSASSIYGPSVTTAVLDEDAMDIDTPILQPKETVTFHTPTPPSLILKQNAERDAKQIVSESYLSDAILNNTLTTHTRRGVALVGHLNSGKTALLNLLHRSTLLSPEEEDVDDGGRNDSSGASNPTAAERAHRISLQSSPITMPLQTTFKSKTHAITIIDTPGHVQFHDEVVASLRSVDGAILCVDVLEGIMMGDEMVLRQALLRDGLNVVLVLNKIDRLIVELKLPLEDAFCKLRNVVEAVNALVEQIMGDRGGTNKKYPKFCPTRGNVAFASSLHGWCFTLGSFAEMYVDYVDGCGSYDDDEDDLREDKGVEECYGSGILGRNLPTDEFSKRLWGNVFLCPKSRTFRKKARDCIPTAVSPAPPRRTFVQFILEPIYKLYSACLGEAEKDVGKVLRSVGVHLARDQLRASPGVLLKAAFEKFFGNPSGLVDMIVQNIPSPSVAALGKVSRCYTGQIDSTAAKSMIQCDPNGPLIIHITKLYPDSSNKSDKNAKNEGLITGSFSAFGRIYSGSVRPGDKVKVLGEAYAPEDDEDMALATVSAVSIPRGRFRTEVSVVKAGNWVMLHGVDANISKTATITSVGGQADVEDVQIFSPLKFSEAGGESVMKLSVEPLNPAELPKMVEGLRRISKSYPMVRTRVEESGEHVLFGTGELYLDCVMHDLRHVYSDIEVKVADPVVGFRETVVETSSIKCFTDTANKRNKLAMIAEPLDSGLAEQLESGKIKLSTWDNKKVGRFFQKKYDWDLLSARSVWAFGDSATHGPNILLDDTLPGEVDKSLLNSTKAGIVQGFQWAMREGPLCEEPVRSTKLKILDVVLADRPIHRGAGQIIPTTRKVVHSSLLTATPRLMEPVYRLQIQCRESIVDSISPLLTKRRGHIVEDRPMAGTPLFTLKAFLPVIDSFGFETDLRTYTQGQAMVHSVFDHWAVVPGDPLDKNIILHPLEPSPPQHLARDFLLKTRGRKGLSEDVSLVKFFNEDMIDQLES